MIKVLRLPKTLTLGGSSDGVSVTGAYGDRRFLRSPRLSHHYSRWTKACSIML